MSTADIRYNLTVNLAITKQQRHGGPEGYWQTTQDRLNVEESMDLGGLDFIGLMAVLAQLHEAVAGIRPTPPQEFPACVHRPETKIRYFEPCPACNAARLAALADG